MSNNSYPMCIVDTPGYTFCGRELDLDGRERTYVSTEYAMRAAGRYYPNAVCPACVDAIIEIMRAIRARESEVNLVEGLQENTGFYTDDIDSKAAREAVIQSIQQDEIVTLTPDSDDLDEVLIALRAACEDSVTYQSAGDHTGTVREHWGTDEDGDEWRVHVRY